MAVLVEVNNHEDDLSIVKSVRVELEISSFHLFS